MALGRLLATVRGLLGHSLWHFEIIEKSLLFHIFSSMGASEEIPESSSAVLGTLWGVRVVGEGSLQSSRAPRLGAVDTSRSLGATWAHLVFVF